MIVQGCIFVFKCCSGYCCCFVLLLLLLLLLCIGVVVVALCCCCCCCCFVLHAFVGYRGSVVVHVNPTCAGGGPEAMSSLVINRIDHSPFLNLSNFVTNTSYWVLQASAGSAAISQQASIAGNSWPIVSAGNGGMTMSNGRTQSGVSATIPQYNMTRFNSVFPRDVLPDGPTRDTGLTTTDGFRIDTSFVKKDALSNDFPVLDVYWRTGVDFNPVFFTGVPRFYSYQLSNPVVS